MDASEIERQTRIIVAERDLLLWEDFPWGGATVLWPDTEELAAFFAVMETLEAPVLYMEGAGEIVGFAVNGVIHAFPSPETRQRLLGDPQEREIDFDEEYSEGVSDHRNPYYDYRSGRTAEGQLRDLVDRIVADQRFDGYRSRRLVAEYVTQLDAQDAEMVETVALRVFTQTVGKELDNSARRLVPDLASDPDFDPLAWGDDLQTFVHTRLPDEDPRVLERLETELHGYARESGLASAAEREVVQTARSVFDSLPALVHDQLGFTSKNPRRLQLVDSYLGDLPENRKQQVLRELVDLETDLNAATREARYATAARRSLDRGLSKAEVSRRLGISTAVIDRIVSANRSDVNLDAEDPILTVLVPEIR